MPPRVSILMAAFNAGNYLEEAVESLLCQTFGDFELILVDDASKDRTAELTERFSARDSRVTIIRNEANLGLVGSLNRGLEHCRAELIARADADDVFHPQRLQDQFSYLHRHPEVGVVGSAVSFIDKIGMPVKRVLWDFPLGADDIRVHSLLGCRLWHTAVMFRKSLVEQVGGYRYEMKGGPEDYDLWASLFPKTKLVNLATSLAKVRLHNESTTATWKNGFEMYCEIARRLQSQYLQRALDINETRDVVSLCGCDGDMKTIDVDRGLSLCRELIEAVRRKESLSVSTGFARCCSNALLRQASTLVYSRPSVAKRLATHACRIDISKHWDVKTIGTWVRASLPTGAVALLKQVRNR